MSCTHIMCLHNIMQIEKGIHLIAFPSSAWVNFVVIDTDVLGIHNARWGTVQPIFSCQMIKTKHPSKCVSYKNAAIHGLSLSAESTENQESHCLNGPHIPKVGCITCFTRDDLPVSPQDDLVLQQFNLTTDSHGLGAFSVSPLKKQQPLTGTRLDMAMAEKSLLCEAIQSMIQQVFFVRKNT